MATDDAVNDLEHQLALMLRRARAFSSRLAKDLHPDLEPAAYPLLVFLATTGPSRPTDVAQAFGVGKATMSRQLRALDDLGLVTRAPDPQDGRSQLLSLTPAAAERLEAIRTARRQGFRDLLDAWPDPDIARLASLLGRLNELVASVEP